MNNSRCSRNAHLQGLEFFLRGYQPVTIWETDVGDIVIISPLASERHIRFTRTCYLRSLREARGCFYKVVGPNAFIKLAELQDGVWVTPDRDLPFCYTQQLPVYKVPP